MALSSIFTIAKSSLFAHQQALAVTSANLSNANNPAYSRQVALFATMPPDHRASFSFGTGVNVQDVLRIRNNVTDVQIRANNQGYYDANKRSAVLSQVEALFTEPSEFGLSNLLNGFFNSWDKLAFDPQSLSLRTDVVQSAQVLSEKISNVYSGITQSRSDTRAEATEVTSRINGILQQLNIVNKQIYEGAVVGNGVNDLLDSRDTMLEELSQYVNINVSIDENQVANVSIGGVFAVDGLHYKEFKIDQKNDKIFLTTDGSETTASLNGGSLNALLKLYSNELPEQLALLDELSFALMQNVNSIHSQGFAITDPPLTGIDFFTNYESGKLEINQDILDDPSYIAVSEDGMDGDNTIALKLAELKNSKILNNRTLSENYSKFITDVANEIRLQNQNMESYSLGLVQLQQTKLEYSGVSTDEEMMNVMKYQRSYDAAAKLINVADELMQTLLTLV
jgi:flagellar hook-associated protein 1 FlgK